MVCELLGSATLSSRLDPEDLREVIAAYRRVVAKIVAGFDGFVGKSMGEYVGEGVLVYFGYPTAQENDAERAVRAALAIQRALSEHNSEKVNEGAPELSARVGLDLGLVVVEPTGEVFGEAPNIAARVQAFAEPGTIVVTANVHRQVAGLFVAEDKGAHELQGVARACDALSRRARERRPAAGSRAAADALRRSRGGIGPAGRADGSARRRAKVSSSLLSVSRASASRDWWRSSVQSWPETSHTWVEWSALQLLQNTPLHPFAEWGRIRFETDSSRRNSASPISRTLWG